MYSSSENDDSVCTSASSGSPDIDVLLQRVQTPIPRPSEAHTDSPCPSPTGECPQPGLMIREEGTACKKRRVSLVADRSKPAPAPKPDFKNEACSFTTALQAANKTPESKHINYVVTIAERLDQIQSVKRVAILKHHIDNLIHEALMEEMVDDWLCMCDVSGKRPHPRIGGLETQTRQSNPWSVNGENTI